MGKWSNSTCAGSDVPGWAAAGCGWVLAASRGWGGSSSKAGRSQSSQVGAPRSGAGPAGWCQCAWGYQCWPSSFRPSLHSSICTFRAEGIWRQKCWENLQTWEVLTCNISIAAQASQLAVLSLIFPNFTLLNKYIFRLVCAGLFWYICINKRNWYRGKNSACSTKGF